MKNQLSKLSEEDRALLLRAPALFSLLAASTDGPITHSEKAEAIELSHLRTFTAPPTLQPYYREVEKIFQPELEKLIEKYSPITDEQQEALQREAESVYAVLDKLDENFKFDMVVSLKSYARHVGRVHTNFLEYFVFPLSIWGITE
ncbi:hypothetical protein JMN32_15505 [Fulvivirga sp. 29W222]|uniref:Uncharacterized protein n=1 Tax=Fulvivirga marina TaxID=2494733 RepID=A0A937KCT0_9BACT|nr:hypothetical protein [Fulvivirga marina]MBL6447724.1 hypothetical protein [Fulvivirga marina]